MPEAVIVSAARSPIGRAFKGSLTELRPDDLTATIVRAALDKIPELDPRDIDDLYLGCGLPGGESGFNMGRIVVGAARLRPPARRDDHPLLLLVGADHADGLPRDQGRRGRRVHLRRRGDRLAVRQGQLRQPARTPGTRSSPTPRRRTDELAQGGQDWHDPREDGRRPGRLHRDGADRRERRPAARARPARSSTSSACAARTSPRRRSTTASGPTRSPRSRPPTAPWSAPTTAPAPGVTLRGGQRPQAGVPSRRRGDGRQLLRAQRRRRRGRGDVRHQGRRSSASPRWPGSSPPA